MLGSFDRLLLLHIFHPIEIIRKKLIFLGVKPVPSIKGYSNAYINAMLLC